MIFLKFVKKILASILLIFIFNCFESFTHITIAYSIFNIVMISLFDIFGFILCVVLKIFL
ncbi:MAG: pro-sigmaK processing inhibitor BofA family protein [Erysipelotrichales bacterium]|nr:pro-sigmaK processing inhibitor BofA family protein [Erysipelotrichales bacterium]